MTLALVMAGSPTDASGRSTTVIPVGEFVIAGTPVQCGKALTVITSLDEVAMTYPGYILLDPSLFQMPVAIQHFWYAHECAHQLFGYDEIAADCWAIQAGKLIGWFSPQDFDWLDRNAIYMRADAAHRAGAERVADLRACYARAPAPSAWGRKVGPFNRQAFASWERGRRAIVYPVSSGHSPL